VHVAVLVGFIAGSMTIVGCSNYENTVVNDPSTSKNKRTAKVDELKNTKPKARFKNNAGSDSRR
jgi:hypothetical protein